MVMYEAGMLPRSKAGHPLVGDEVYGPKKCPFKGLQGQRIHFIIYFYNLFFF